MAYVRNESRNTLVAEHVRVATGFFERLRGLLGRSELPAGHGLWIENCNSIHTFFMRFPIDAVFVSADRKVVKTYEALEPFRCTRIVFGAKSVLELPSGTLKGVPLDRGDRLSLGYGA